MTNVPLDRREWLRRGAAGAVAAVLPKAAPAAPREVRRCILLLLTGGPSQLETWDPKPSAPVEVRGPFRPTRTAVPGTHLSESLPRMAALAGKVAFVRSLHHDAAPVHETGLQLTQTGHLSRPGLDYPHFGSVLAWHRRGRTDQGVPSFVLLPGPLRNTGLSISRGQGAGVLGERYAGSSAPAGWLRGLAPEHPAVVERYGQTSFGASCLLARRLIEAGSDCVTVNMFTRLTGRVSWDCHAEPGVLPATLDDYRTTLCPALDSGFSALVEDLDTRGLLESTLVVAMGEFGRTPHLNANGGRDHWPRVWSIALAGGGVRGGQVLGASDRLGGEPLDRPVTPAELTATIYHVLGVDLGTRLVTSDGTSVPLVTAKPLWELL